MVEYSEEIICPECKSEIDHFLVIEERPDTNGYAFIRDGEIEIDWDESNDLNQDQGDFLCPECECSLAQTDEEAKRLFETDDVKEVLKEVSNESS